LDIGLYCAWIAIFVGAAANTETGFLAVIGVADVCLHEAEVLPLRGGDHALHFIEVALVAGG
jgi:hypothetical protein